MTNPTTLPVKPDAIYHVTDAHWEAALKVAFEPFGQTWESFMNLWTVPARLAVIDHARALILLKEVEEPVDPLDVALNIAWEDLPCNPSTRDFNRFCRKHFAGMTFPEKTS